MQADYSRFCEIQLHLIDSCVPFAPTASLLLSVSFRLVCSCSLHCALFLLNCMILPPYTSPLLSVSFRLVCSRSLHRALCSLNCMLDRVPRLPSDLSFVVLCLIHGHIVVTSSASAESEEVLRRYRGLV